MERGRAEQAELPRGIGPGGRVEQAERAERVGMHWGPKSFDWVYLEA